jgi:hypothetical protein
MSAAPAMPIPAAQNEAMQRNDHGLRIAVNGLKGVVITFVDRNDHVGVSTQLFNVHASAKALTLRTNDNDVNVAPRAQSLDFSGNTRPFGTVKRIYRWFIEDDLRNTCVNCRVESHKPILNLNVGLRTP